MGKPTINVLFTRELQYHMCRVGRKVRDWALLSSLYGPESWFFRTERVSGAVQRSGPDRPAWNPNQACSKQQTWTEYPSLDQTAHGLRLVTLKCFCTVPFFDFDFLLLSSIANIADIAKKNSDFPENWYKANFRHFSKLCCSISFFNRKCSVFFHFDWNL